MIFSEHDTLIFGCCENLEDALEYMHVKQFSGWEVLVPPFVTKHLMVDSGEETVISVPSEWTFVLHRF